ncbi:MAG: ribosome modulation factor [Gammaproteobacteria bacterium]|nr:MAG: ribosome modulation factor [Gammaproteobacteria bacterium]RLA49550.1 MAG: ribosome modulation factor [Gammaproteobacteria bacterium]
MKRQKRDISQRAYSKGYQQGYHGRSDERCPFQEDSATAREWIKGWQEGHDDNLDGIKTQASQQKVIALR